MHSALILNPSVGERRNNSIHTGGLGVSPL